jgi:hypothetical protein
MQAVGFYEEIAQRCSLQMATKSKTPHENNIQNDREKWMTSYPMNSLQGSLSEARRK